MATQPAPQNLDPEALLIAAPEEEFALIERAESELAGSEAGEKTEPTGSGV